MNFNENYVVVKINLTSVDNAIATLGSFNGIKGIAGGDIAALDLDAVRKSNQTRAKRGDMNIIYDKTFNVYSSLFTSRNFIFRQTWYWKNRNPVI